MARNLIKIFYIMTILFTIFFIFSCKKKTEVKLAYTENQTVKDQIEDKESEISWTRELEGDRLTTPITFDDKYKNDYLSFGPEYAKIIKDYNEPVFPEIEDFGSLDTRNIPADIKEIVNGFFAALNNDPYVGAEKYFNTSYLFNFIFFRDDIIFSWEVNFDEPFPLSEEAEAERQAQLVNNKSFADTKKGLEDNKKKLDELNNKLNGASDSSDDQMSVEEINNQIKSVEQTIKKQEKEIKKLEKKYKKVPELSIFTRYICGEPFITEDVIQLPVRFYCKPGSVDVTLYINKTKSNSINQITIDRWNKA